jgi:hypothetical protein
MGETNCHKFFKKKTAKKIESQVKSHSWHAKKKAAYDAQHDISNTRQGCLVGYGFLAGLLAARGVGGDRFMHAQFCGVRSPNI